MIQFDLLAYAYQLILKHQQVKVHTWDINAKITKDKLKETDYFETDSIAVQNSHKNSHKKVIQQYYLTPKGLY